MIFVQAVGDIVGAATKGFFDVVVVVLNIEGTQGNKAIMKTLAEEIEKLTKLDTRKR